MQFIDVQNNKNNYLQFWVMKSENSVVRLNLIVGHTTIFESFLDFSATESI